MSSPFTSVTVQPSYGFNQVLLRWVVAEQWRGLGVLIGRSLNSGISFEFINPDDECIFNTEEFLDTDLPKTSKLVDIYYKLAVETENGEIIMGPPVAALGDMSRTELRLASRIAHEEFLKMYKSDGIKMLHFTPKNSGKRNSLFDPETGIVRGQECKHDVTQSFGLPFEGGYSDPIQTWIIFGQQKLEEAQSPDTAGAVESRVAPVRMLCYPRPRLDHLLVNPITDERWAVGAVVTPYLFKGVVAVAYDTTLHLLNRTDTRYRLDISQYQPIVLARA